MLESKGEEEEKTSFRDYVEEVWWLSEEQMWTLFCYCVAVFLLTYPETAGEVTAQLDKELIKQITSFYCSLQL